MEKHQKLYISVSQGLLDPKHVKGFGPNPVFLYLWFLDHMTTLTGAVLGGMPIKSQSPCDTLGISRRTYERWIKELVVAGYIEIVRAPRGLIITITKAKKIFTGDLKRSATSSTSNKKRYANLVTSDVTGLAHHRTKVGTSNKTRQQEDKTVRQDIPPITPPKKKKVEIITELEKTAIGVIGFWNNTHNSRYSAHKPIMNNLKYWLTQYSKHDIAQAIINIKADNFWRDKMEPTTFFRRKNPNHEEVDYIAKFLHAPTRAENQPKKSRLIF